MMDVTVQLLKKRTQTVLGILGLGIVLYFLASFFLSIPLILVNIWYLIIATVFLPVVALDFVLRRINKESWKTTIPRIALLAGLIVGLGYFLPSSIELSILFVVLLMGAAVFVSLLLFVPIARQELAEPGWFNRVYRDEPMEADRVKWEKSPTLYTTVMFVLAWYRMPKSRKNVHTF